MDINTNVLMIHCPKCGCPKFMDRRDTLDHVKDGYKNGSDMFTVCANKGFQRVHAGIAMVDEETIEGAPVPPCGYVINVTVELL